MSNKASNELMELLHAEMVKEFLTRLRSGEATASDLSVMRQFLKDNNINASDSAPDMGALASTLKTLGNLPYDGEVPEEFKKNH